MISHSSSIATAPFAFLAKCPVALYYCVVVATGLPELAFLLSLIFCEDAYQHIVSKTASARSKLFGGFNVAALLIAFFMSGTPRFDMAFPTVVAFLVIGFTSKPRKDKAKVCKEVPDSASCSSPVLIQAPKFVPAPKLVEAPQVVPQVKTARGAVISDASSDEQAVALVLPWRRERVAKAEKVEEKVVPVPATPQDIDSEVQDILSGGLFNPSDDKIVRQLVGMVRRSVNAIVPEANVFGSAVGNLSYNAAKGAKPEVEIVATASPEVLKSRLTAFFLKGPSNDCKKPKSLATLGPDSLQKTATRVLSERLNNMRYWRSQFTGPEPKTVLLAPASLGICDYSIRVSFSVNNTYPANLVNILSKADKHTQELIAIVTKWAKVRGIAHTAKGHLHPYAHSLLVVYFLRQHQGDLSGKTLVEIFEEFVHFYKALFDRPDHVVSICFTAHGKQVEQSPDSALWGIPYIEDPFESSSNAASTMCAESVTRLREELRRAAEILSGGVTTLSKLLEQWEFPRPGSPGGCAEQSQVS